MLEYKLSTGDIIFINPRSVAAVAASEDISTWSYIYTFGGCWLVQHNLHDVLADISKHLDC